MKNPPDISSSNFFSIFLDSCRWRDLDPKIATPHVRLHRSSQLPKLSSNRRIIISRCPTSAEVQVKTWCCLIVPLSDMSPMTTTAAAVAGALPPTHHQSSPFRSDCLAGRVAIVTGGGSGIGFEIARQLVRHGCHGVALFGRRADFLQRAAELLRHEAEEVAKPSSSNPGSLSQPCVVTYQVCDVRDPDQCERAVRAVIEAFGAVRLDVLVNGAAGNFLAPAHELTPKGFATVMAIDAAGTFHMCRAAYPLLRASQHHPVVRRQCSKDLACVLFSQRAPSLCTCSLAHLLVRAPPTQIINISATLQYGATWWQTHASAAKAAVDSLTRSLALEWGGIDDNVTDTGGVGARIRVVGIAPGPIANTPGTTKLAPTATTIDSDRPPVVDDWVRERIPLGRMGEAFEIGLAAVYLCTALYVTGDVLVVDGGEWLSKPPLVPRHLVGKLSRQVEARSRAQAPRPKL